MKNRVQGSSAAERLVVASESLEEVSNLTIVRHVAYVDASDAALGPRRLIGNHRLDLPDEALALAHHVHPGASVGPGPRHAPREGARVRHAEDHPDFRAEEPSHRPREVRYFYAA